MLVIIRLSQNSGIVFYYMYFTSVVNRKIEMLFYIRLFMLLNKLVCIGCVCWGGGGGMEGVPKCVIHLTILCYVVGGIFACCWEKGD